MLICVATHAITRQAQVRTIQIFGLDSHAPGRRNIRGLMTIRTGNSRMFSFQHKARFVVIERFAIGLPANEGKIFPVMIGMAARALLAGGIGSHQSCMQTLLVNNAVTNFRVTFEAL